MKIIKVVGEVDRDGLVLCLCESDRNGVEWIWCDPDFMRSEGF